MRLIAAKRPLEPPVARLHPQKLTDGVACNPDEDFEELKKSAPPVKPQPATPPDPTAAANTDRPDHQLAPAVCESRGLNTKRTYFYTSLMSTRRQVLCESNTHGRSQRPSTIEHSRSSCIHTPDESRTATRDIAEASARLLTTRELRNAFLFYTSGDLTRQLFVDDYLVKDTTFTRTFHQAKIYDDGPVLNPETKLEREAGTAEGAVPFDGSVRFDPKDRLFNMWHSCGFLDGICYETSKDCIHWDRPNLDVSPRENRVLPYQKGSALSGFFVAGR